MHRRTLGPSLSVALAVGPDAKVSELAVVILKRRGRLSEISTAKTRPVSDADAIRRHLFAGFVGWRFSY